MVLTIRPATRAEAEWIAPNLREEDAREVLTASGRHPEDVVPESLGLSDECYSIRLTTDGKIDEHPCALFGVGTDPTNAGLGVMWMLCTPAVRRAALSILREAKSWLDHFNTKYPSGIHNIVDSRNDLHVRWLLLMGFQFGDTYTVRGVPFVHAMRFTQCVTP